jgi:hypothetical protein
MLGSATFDLVLGMVFLFLLLSLVVSAIREAIEARLKTRSAFLAHAIQEMLTDTHAKSLYEHPLIKALYDGGKYETDAAGFTGNNGFKWIWNVVKSLRVHTNLPSYIPARTFALALLDLAAAGNLPGTQAPGSTPPPLTPPPATLVARVRLALGGRTDDLATGILAALSTAADNDEKAIDAIQKWYDAAMDRVSGWYKRETQHILFWLGLALAVGMNVDTIYLAKFLAADTGARQHLAQTVEQAYNEGKIPNPALIGAPGTAASDAAAAQASDSAAAANGATAASSDLKDTEAAIKATDVRVSEAIHRVIDLNLPIGWTPIRRDEFFDSHNVLNSLSTILGWLVTAFGLSFGAPFWFDVLNKVMVIRSTVKPHEKSPEEASQDHQK